MTSEDHTSEDRRDDELLRRLRSLAGGPMPPAGLEEATVARLRASGWLGGRPRSAWRTLLAASIAVALPLAGFFAGRWSRPPESPEPSFALLLYGGSEGESPERPHAGADRQIAWARRPHPEGRVLGGEPLKPDARILGLAAGAPLAAAGPLRGFFLVDAADLDAATDLARSNPHLEAGGVIEVRPVGLPDPPPRGGSAAPPSLR
jgi:hypothetical protein